MLAASGLGLEPASGAAALRAPAVASRGYFMRWAWLMAARTSHCCCRGLRDRLVAGGGGPPCLGRLPQPDTCVGAHARGQVGGGRRLQVSGAAWCCLPPPLLLLLLLLPPPLAPPAATLPAAPALLRYPPADWLHCLPPCPPRPRAGGTRPRWRTCSGAPPKRQCLPRPQWTGPSASGTRGSRWAQQGTSCLQRRACRRRAGCGLGCRARLLPRLPAPNPSPVPLPRARLASVQSKSMLAVAAHDADVNVISWNRATSYMLASGGPCRCPLPQGMHGHSAQLSWLPAPVPDAAIVPRAPTAVACNQL